MALESTIYSSPQPLNPCCAHQFFTVYKYSGRALHAQLFPFGY